MTNYFLKKNPFSNEWRWVLCYKTPNGVVLVSGFGTYKGARKCYINMDKLDRSDFREVHYLAHVRNVFGDLANMKMLFQKDGVKRLYD